MTSEGRTFQPQSAWSSLPQDVLFIIMGKGGHGKLKEVAAMDLVCKAWHAAFRQFPGRFHSKLWRPTADDLARLCSMLPAVAKLKVSKLGFGKILAPFSLCSGLTSLTVERPAYQDWHYGPPTSIDFSLLPATLKCLKLRSVMMDLPTSTAHSGLGLTELEIMWPIGYRGDPPSRAFGPATAFDILQYLPHLKVLSLGTYDKEYLLPLEQAFSSALQRLNDLTSLRCYRGLLRHVNSEARPISNLRVLHLPETVVSSLSCSAFGSLFPGLTFLDLDNPSHHGARREVVGQRPQSVVTAMQSLRAMTVARGLQDYFYDLAPCSLQSLTFKADNEQLRHLRRLSSLTRLELSYMTCDTHMEHVHGLGVVELVLYRSSHVEHIFAPGALLKLQNLHIENCYPGIYKPTPSTPEEQQERQQLSERTNNIIFALPDLHQVSGASCFFEFAQDHQLRHWERSQSKSLPCFPSYRVMPLEEMSIWRKPTMFPSIE